MNARTEGCIALIPQDTVTGSVRFLSLTTLREVVRDKWTTLPIPDTVIERMNDMSSKQSRKLSKDPTFKLRGEEVNEDNTERDHEAQITNNEDVIIREIDSREYTNEVEAEQRREQDNNRLDMTTTVNEVYKGVEEEGNLLRFQLDDDGDVIMEDAFDYSPEMTEEHSGTESGLVNDDVGEARGPDSAAEADLPAPESRYGLREKRSNWRNRVFRTAVKAIEMDKTKYIYHTTIKQCTEKLGKDATIKAITEELTQMIDKGVWEPIMYEDVTDKKSIIPSRLFLKEKFNAEGEFEKLKARLVGGGHKQDKTLYSEDEISSPTMSTKSVFILASIAAEEARQVMTGDIPGAYLNADMSGEVCMSIPQEVSSVLVDLDQGYRKFLRTNGMVTVKLKKALYGCVESSKLWYEYLRSRLHEMGFAENPVDPCVFNKEGETGQCTIGVYSDDLIITCGDKKVMDEAQRRLNNTFHGIKWKHGDKHNYLGMTFQFDRNQRKVTIAMSNYVDELLAKYHVNGVSKTPCGMDLFTVREDDAALNVIEKETYHSNVASVLYLAKRVRPDLLLTVAFLTTRVNSPTEGDKRKLEKLMRYINGTRNLSITIDGSQIRTPWVSIDASYGTHHDGKSHTGLIEGVGTTGFHFKSSKQKTVTRSSTESEIMGVSDGLSQAISTREFLKHQRYDIGPTMLFQDNTSCIRMLETGKITSERSKHIDIRNFWVKEKIDNGDITIKYVKSDDMVSDLLTKPITGKRFFILRDKIMGGA